MKYIYCHSLRLILKHILGGALTDVHMKLDQYSKEFNTFWKSEVYTLNYIKLGGYGFVATMHVGDQPLKCLVSEFKEKTEKDVVVKTNRNSISFKCSQVNMFWLIDHEVSEIYFASLIKYITKLKICPFLGNYLAINTSKPDVVIFLEKYDLEFIEFINKNLLTSKNIIQFIFQFIYTIYILKTYLGMVHFDTHMRNVMIQYMKKPKYEYMLFFDKFKKNGILLPFDNYCLKIIDFGLCTVDLRHSVHPSLKSSLRMGAYNFLTDNIKIPNLYTNTVSNPSKYCTVEFQYFILHVYQYIEQKIPNSPVLDTIRDFCSIFYATHEPVLKSPKLEEGKIIISQHDVGLEESVIKLPNDLITGLFRYCKERGQITDYKDCQIYSPFSSQIDFSKIFFINPYNVKPAHSSKIYSYHWFEDSFFITRTTLGYRWNFQKNIYITSPSKSQPHFGIGLYYKQQPFHFSNAYLSFLGNSIKFHYARSKLDLEMSFYCGTFILFENKIIKHLGNAKLLFGIKNGIFTVLYLPNGIDYGKLIKMAKKSKIESLIDASNGCVFIFENREFTSFVTNKIPTLYVKIE